MNEVVDLEESSLLEKVDGLTLQDQHKIRQSYGNLLTEPISRGDEGLHEIAAVIESTNKLFKSGNVLLPTEGTYDAEMLCKLSEMAKRRFLGEQEDLLQFDMVEFAHKLKAKLKNDLLTRNSDEETTIAASQWENYGRLVTPLLRIPPVLHYLYGGFARDTVEKPRIARREKRTLQKDEVGAEKRPTLIGSAAEVAEIEETTRMVDKTWKFLQRCLEKETNICFFSFVVNSTSYEKTVQNMFYVSFLIRDKKACLKLDDSGLPVLCVVDQERNSSTPDASANANKNISQFIATLDRVSWKKICETFGIVKPALAFNA